MDLLSPDFLALSADLREVALIIILTRAGLSLNLEELKKVGRPAVLMCFVPAAIEIFATAMLAPYFLGFTLAEALLLGSIIAAVSPAVVVPRMLRLIYEGVGVKKSIPQIVLAGASVDDVFVLVLFTSFLGINQGKQFTLRVLGQIPIAILLGLLAGAIAGIALAYLFKVVHLRDSVKALIILALSFLLMGLEDKLEGITAFSGMLSVMSLSIMIFRFSRPVAERLANKFNKLWVAAEILLFVLVGASVNLDFALKAGIAPILFVFMCYDDSNGRCLFGSDRHKFNKQRKTFLYDLIHPKGHCSSGNRRNPFYTWDFKWGNDADGRCTVNHYYCTGRSFSSGLIL